MNLPYTRAKREDNVRIRLLERDSPNDRSQWLDLHAALFHKRITTDLWNWIFLVNSSYINKKPLILLAEKGNTPIGSACLIPTTLTYSDGREETSVSACFAGKSMVVPSFRGRGLYTQMLHQRMEMAAEEGYEILLTYTSNSHVERSLVSRGWKEIPPIIERTFYLPFPLGSQRSLRPVRNLFRFVPRILYDLSLSLDRSQTFQIQHHRAIECISFIENLHNLTLQSPGLFGNRSASYLKWRYGRRSDRFHCIIVEKDESPCGYIVLYVGDEGEKKISMLLDFFATNRIIAKRLLHEAIQYLQERSFYEFWIELHFKDEFLYPLTNPLFGFTTRGSSFFHTRTVRFFYYPLTSLQHPNIHSQQIFLNPVDDLSNFAYI